MCLPLRASRSAVPFVRRLYARLTELLRARGTRRGNAGLLVDGLNCAGPGPCNTRLGDSLLASLTHRITCSRVNPCVDACAARPGQPPARVLPQLELHVQSVRDVAKPEAWPLHNTRQASPRACARMPAMLDHAVRGTRHSHAKASPASCCSQLARAQTRSCAGHENGQPVPIRQSHQCGHCRTCREGLDVLARWRQGCQRRRAQWAWPLARRLAAGLGAFLAIIRARWARPQQLLRTPSQQQLSKESRGWAAYPAQSQLRTPLKQMQMLHSSAPLRFVRATQAGRPAPKPCTHL